MSGADRVAARRRQFLAAGLELMGTVGTAATTVRSVAATTGLAARYLAESFATIDDLHLAVFDEIVAEIESRGMAAIAGPATNTYERARSALATVTSILLDDPRKGRIILIESVSSPVLGPRRIAEARRIAALVGHVARNTARADVELLDLQITTQFVIGGVGEALTAALLGEIATDRDHLIDRLTALLFVALNEHSAHRSPVGR